MKNSISARSPLSPTLWPSDAFRWWQSLALAVAVFIALIAPAIALLGAMVAVHLLPVKLVSASSPTLTWPLLIAQFVSYVPAIALLLWALPRVARRTLAEIGFRAPRWSDLAWGFAGAAAMLLAATIVGAFQESIWHIKTDEVQVQYLRNARGSIVAGFVFLACIAAPFSEELVFRGFFFNALLRYMPSAVAIVVSALVFGLVHYQPGNAGAIVPLAAGGAVLAYVYFRSGSLIASMVAHCLFNLFTVVAVLVFHQTS